MPHLQNKKLAQVAIVVRDIEAAIDKWTALLGCDRPNKMTTEPGLTRNQAVDGVPSDAQAHLAFFDLGGVQLELIQPLGGESSWQKILDERGEGVHHIAFWTEDMKQTQEAIAPYGPLWHIGDMGGGGQFAYFKTEPELGVTLEILENEKTPI